MNWTNDLSAIAAASCFAAFFDLMNKNGKRRKRRKLYFYSGVEMKIRERNLKEKGINSRNRE